MTEFNPNPICDNQYPTRPVEVYSPDAELNVYKKIGKELKRIRQLMEQRDDNAEYICTTMQKMHNTETELSDSLNYLCDSIDQMRQSINYMASIMSRYAMRSGLNAGPLDFNSPLGLPSKKGKGYW